MSCTVVRDGNIICDPHIEQDIVYDYVNQSYYMYIFGHIQLGIYKPFVIMRKDIKATESETFIILFERNY